MSDQTYQLGLEVYDPTFVQLKQNYIIFGNLQIFLRFVVKEMQTDAKSWRLVIYGVGCLFENEISNVNVYKYNTLRTGTSYKATLWSLVL